MMGKKIVWISRQYQTQILSRFGKTDLSCCRLDDGTFRLFGILLIIGSPLLDLLVNVEDLFVSPAPPTAGSKTTSRVRSYLPRQPWRLDKGGLYSV